MAALHKVATVHEGNLFESNCNLFRSMAGQRLKMERQALLCVFRTQVKVCRLAFLILFISTGETGLEKVSFCEICSGSFYHYKVQPWSLHFPTLLKLKIHRNKELGI